MLELVKQAFDYATTIKFRGVYSGKSDCLVLLKTSRFTENRQKPSCVSIKNWSETYEGAELAQNRDQIWTQQAQKPL